MFFPKLGRWFILAFAANTLGCSDAFFQSTSFDARSLQTAREAEISPIAGETIQAVVTIGMVADAVRIIGGDHVQVRQLMRPGIDPHLYQVTRDDVRAIFAADIIFASGLMLEGKMAHTLQQLSRRRPVILVAQRVIEDRAVKALSGSSDDHLSSHQSDVDPHLWMDMAAWAKILPLIADALSRLKPTATADFQQRSLEYESEIMALHQYGIDAIATIPMSSRHLITSHDAFGYFGRAYGLQVTGVQGLSTDSEAGLVRINQLVDMIVQQAIRAVFVESSVPRKSLEAVIEGVRARGQSIVIGGELFSDSAGPAGTYEGTYLGMMDHNFTTIARALGGKVPPRGFRGELEVVSPIAQRLPSGGLGTVTRHKAVVQ